MKLLKCSREKFLESITDDKADGFGKTFKAKADMMKLWDNCWGLFEGADLMGAYSFSVTKTNPRIVNFQLLHTFAKHRYKGVGKILVKDAFKRSYELGADYIRISSEISAIDFYKKCGIEFIGRQKSGCLLTITKLTSDLIEECEVDINDPRLRRYLFGKAKGTPVELFMEVEPQGMEEW